MKRVMVCVFLMSLLLMSSMQVRSAASDAVSTVTFEFDGMMGLFMGNTQKVSVGIIDAHHHKPEITVYKIVDNEKREVAKLTAEQLKRTLEVSVVGGDIIARRSMRLGSYLAFNGRESDERDFSWTFDIEREIYQRKLKIKENGFWGKIHFNTGIFYTNKLSEEKFKFVATDGSRKTLPVFRRIGQPAARIDLDRNQELLISGLTEPLKLKAEYDTNYLVTIYNLPPPEMANLNHFLMYYDIIDEKLTKYEPVAIKQSFGGGVGFGCPPRVFGESGLN